MNPAGHVELSTQDLENSRGSFSVRSSPPRFTLTGPLTGACTPICCITDSSTWRTTGPPPAPCWIGSWPTSHRPSDREYSRRRTSTDHLDPSWGQAAVPPVGRPTFPVAAAPSDDRVPASVQNTRSHFSQRCDCSISSSCLSRSVNSIARRRNWRATATRRCSSSARRSSRPMLCASVWMVVAPGGLAVKLQTPGSVRLVR